jgi:hypothetical protein
MGNGSKKRSSRQRGASLVEFCFTMPVLLLIAGATVDLSRYMRFLQITTFVSQETAEQIYRQCSDITIYTPADITTTSLKIDRTATESAITSCVERLQLGAQELLNASVGRAAVSSKVFRWKITETSPTASCNSVTILSPGDVREMYAKADVDCDGPENEDEDDDNSESTPDDTPGDESPNDNTQSKTSSIIRLDKDANNEEKSDAKLDDDEKLALEDDGVELRSDGIYQTKSASGTARRLVSPSTLCQKSRVATVEVAYDFEPIVKFLPHMMIKLNTDGSQRETTAL